MVCPGRPLSAPPSVRGRVEECACVCLRVVGRGALSGQSHRLSWLSSSGLCCCRPRFPLADLPVQMADFLPEGGWTCHAFPDASRPQDNVICSLIQVAIVFPLKFIVERMLEIANEAEYADNWLFWRALPESRA